MKLNQFKFEQQATSNAFKHLAAKEKSTSFVGARAARPQARVRAKSVELEIEIEFTLDVF